jgi:hypothetical protein
MTIILIILCLAALIVSSVSLFVTCVALANERDRRVALERARDPEPICGCRHHRSFHDEKGCHSISRPRYENKTKCGCKIYIGPPALELMP